MKAKVSLVDNSKDKLRVRLKQTLTLITFSSKQVLVLLYFAWI